MCAACMREIAETHDDYIQEAKSALGPHRITGEPLAQAIERLRAGLDEARAQLATTKEQLAHAWRHITNVNETLHSIGVHEFETTEGAIRELADERLNALAKAGELQGLRRALERIRAIKCYCDAYLGPCGCGNQAVSIAEDAIGVAP